MPLHGRALTFSFDYKCHFIRSQMSTVHIYCIYTTVIRKLADEEFLIDFFSLSLSSGSVPVHSFFGVMVIVGCQ